MRLFWIAIVATAALVLADPGAAKAQITIGPYQIGRSPTYTPPPPYTVRYSPYPVVSTPASSSTAFTNFNGGLVDVAMDNGLKTMGWTGYGPYSGYYSPFPGSRYLGLATPANYGPWGVNQPVNVPSNWKWVEPRTANPGLRKGWFKGR